MIILYPLIEFERDVVGQRFEKDNNFDIFEMTTSTSEPTTKFINKKFLIFKHYQMDIKNTKCLLLK
jgi:hypothetical protein